MPERNRLDFWVTHHDQCFKLEIPFENILECDGFSSDGSKPNALLLKVVHYLFIYALFWINTFIKPYKGLLYKCMCGNYFYNKI